MNPAALLARMIDLGIVAAVWVVPSATWVSGVVQARSVPFCVNDQRTSAWQQLPSVFALMSTADTVRVSALVG